MQVLDPIDGTKGFLKGSEALYVVSIMFAVFFLELLERIA
jgi:3'-phosphoadenosine 5'-phosphosulfate (PAPS) 3'-phosphatase